MPTVRSALLVTLALAGFAAEPVLPVAATPLAPWLPERTPLPDLPAPIPLGAVRIPLGQGRTLALADAISVRSLAGTWRCSGLTAAATRFADDAQLDRGWQADAFDDRTWDPIQVPLNWYAKYPTAQDPKQPFVIGWYRHGFELSAEDLARRAVLRFGVIGYEADLWINGRPAGSHHGDFTPWEVDVSALVRPGRNTIALRVRTDQGDFGTGALRHVYGSQWSVGNIKGGIWQDAALRLEPTVRVTDVLVSPRRNEGTVRVEATLRNHTGAPRRVQVRAVVQGARAGAPLVADRVVGGFELPAGESPFSAEIPVPGIATWSPEAPHLNHLALVVMAGDEILGVACERFGFRSAEVRDGRFLLNGQPRYLVGDNLKSHEFGGRGQTPQQQAAFIDTVLGGFKANGVTMLRPAHMPPIPAVLERADELGLLIYNEWGWSFSDRLDPVEFPRRNRVELAEWVRRDHNHPSVVMWSCANEVHYDQPLVKDQLNGQVALVRALDRQGRPVSTFSGAGYGYGTSALDTDLIDLHCYFGLRDGAWSAWQRMPMPQTDAYLDRTYGEGWRATKPYLIWESIGFSWGGQADPGHVAGDVERYLRWAAKPTSWGKPNGVGFTGTIGLAAALDPQRGTAWGRRLYGPRIADFIRRDPAVAGFAPWFHDYELDLTRQWSQPVYATLHGANGIAVRHPMPGARIEQTLQVANTTAGPLDGVRAELAVVGADGRSLPVGGWDLPAIPAWSHHRQGVAFTLPEADRAGWWQLRLTLRQGGRDLSRMGFDLATAPMPAPVAAKGPVAVLRGGEDAATTTWLRDLGIEARIVADAGALAGVTVAILPPGRPPQAEDALALRTWVRSGGTLAVLEQPAGESPALGLSARKAGNTFVDLVVPAHPLFAGLEPAHFDTSDHPDLGFWVHAGLAPLTANVLAARGPFLGDQGVTAVVAEGAYGRGRLVASQLLALGQWRRDSVATRYLRNLAAHLVAPTATTAPAPWQEGGGGISVDRKHCRTLDLRAVANRHFRDDAPGDGQGGWTDQGGANDFRMMPLGDIDLHGVPFRIIDPAANQGRGCLVMRGRARPELPLSADGIPVGTRVSRLFALHTAGWVGDIGQLGLTYRLHYADGTITDAPVRAGFEIADWWSPSDLPGARLGLTATNDLLKDVGLFLMAWENPRPQTVVERIEVVSANTLVPVVVALTVETTSEVRLPFAPDAARWKGICDRTPDTPAVTPTVTPAVETAPDGTPAVRLAFPSPVPGAGRPAAIPTALARLAEADRARLAGGPDLRYLTLWVKAEGPGTLELALPRQDWKDAVRSEIACRPGDGWRRIRLSLERDLELGRGKAWGITDLRGELLVYHGRTHRQGPVPAPVTVLVAGACLE